MPRTAALLTVTLLSLQCWLSASVGDSLQAAKARGGDFAKRYGAVDPIVKGDAKGIVVMECWAAPPEMWPKATAIAFGKQLAPNSVRSSAPKALAGDGGEQVLVWTDGTQMILKTFQEKVIQVEVRLKSYKGNRC